MKIKKFYLILLSTIILLNACSPGGVMSNKRSNTSDEFLVHKKKPLVMPPDFDDMPVPRKEKKAGDEKDENTVEELLGVYKGESKEIQSEGDQSLEKSILEKINAN